MAEIKISKRSRIIVGRNGAVLRVNADGSINAVIQESAGVDTVEARTEEPEVIDETDWVILAQLDGVENQPIFLKEVFLSLAGMMGEFRLESFSGEVVTLVRRFVLSTQQSSFSEVFGSPLSIVWAEDGAGVRMRARMLGKNQTGTAWAALNGFR